MKDKDITAINVDDYIREVKKSGKKEIYWSKDEWKIFSKFFEASTGCGIGFDIDINAMDYCIKHHNHKPKSGVLFMGIKHYQVI